MSICDELLPKIRQISIPLPGGGFATPTAAGASDILEALLPIIEAHNAEKRLSDEEIAAVLESPAALEAVIDYHDRSICEGEAMGYPCSFHHKRVAELKAIRKACEALEKEWQT